jgi:hypothetical protein
LGLAITTVVTNILIPPPPVQAPMNCNDFHEDEYFWQRLAVGILVGASVDRILSSGLANNLANGLGSLADDIYRGVGYSLDDVARALGNNGPRLATAGGGSLDNGASAISGGLDDGSGPLLSSSGSGGSPYVPQNPVRMSEAHNANTIAPNTRWGSGNRYTPKTIARGDIDTASELAEISAGNATRMANGDILTSSGRMYGTHPGSNTVFLRSGSPGTVDLTQAEFDIFTKMIQSGGLKSNALRAFNGMKSAGNEGLDDSSSTKLIELFESRL